jgi:hypothetical protein
MARIAATPISRLALVALAALLALGSLATPAGAQGRGHDRRENNRNWNGGYYRAPPIIYGSPYGPSYYGSPYYNPPAYYPPPLIYGPGLNFDFQLR